MFGVIDQLVKKELPQSVNQVQFYKKAGIHYATILSEIETKQKFEAAVPAPQKVDGIQEIIKFVGRIQDDINDIKASLGQNIGLPN